MQCIGKCFQVAHKQISNSLRIIGGFQGQDDLDQTERTAGQKGFDSTTERSFRASKPALQTAYARVDAIDTARPDDAQVTRFMRAGKLSGAGR